MKDAPIWSMRVMGNSTLDDVPVQPLAPGSMEIWDGADVLPAHVQYYHGRGLTDATRLSGLAYTNRSVQHADWLEDMLRARPVFLWNSFVFLEKKVCAALSAFDLGDGRFTRTPIFQSDRKTEVDCDFYLLEFSNAKDTVDRDNTERCRPLYKARPEAGYLLSNDQTGRDIFVHPSAQEGADFWFDPMIRHLQFVSDGVARTLIDLGLRDKFLLYQCKFP